MGILCIGAKAGSAAFDRMCVLAGKRFGLNLRGPCRAQSTCKCWVIRQRAAAAVASRGY